MNVDKPTQPPQVPIKKPKPKRKKRSNAKPVGFQEFEQLAKDILDGQDKSYFEWLHEKHQEVVLTFNLKKKEEIAILAQEEEYNG